MMRIAERKVLRTRAAESAGFGIAAIAMCLVQLARAADPVVISGGDGLPANGSVVHGTVSHTPPSDGQLVINQDSNRAVIHWDSFSIGAGKTVEFVHLDSSAATLNRVTGSAASDILGNLKANGHVLLMNPNGIVFGPSATIDVAALVATTGIIDEGRFITDGSVAINGATGEIMNYGTITAAGATPAEAGLVALVAPSVQNQGTITATSGTILLAGVTEATISMTGGLYEFAVTGATGATVRNAGSLSAGIVRLSTGDAAEVLSGVINLEGIQQASSAIVVDGGEVVLNSDLEAPVVTGNSRVIDVHDIGDASVQDAIDIATSEGATVNVHPGDYTEIAANRDIGIGTYSLGLLANKDDIVIRGVDDSGTPITNANNVGAWITAGAAPGFGMNHGVIADNVTIEGLGFKPNSTNPNKTIEIAGDNFAFRNSVVDNRSAVGGAGALYFGELIGGAEGQITRLTVTGSRFLDGSVSLQNGVGVAGDGETYEPGADRVIEGNRFIGSSNYRFGGLLLTGMMDEVAWRPLPIGAATVGGNHFTGFDESVMVRGEQQGVNLTRIMGENSFDRAVLVTDADGKARGELYESLNGFMRHKFSIQSNIQAGVNRARSGDSVSIGAGTYDEQLSITKSVVLAGTGRDDTYISPTTLEAGPHIISIEGAATDVELSGVTIQGPVAGITSGIFVGDGAHARIHDNRLRDMRPAADINGTQTGLGILVGRAAASTSGTAEIRDNVIEGYQKGGIVVDGVGSNAEVTGNRITGAGPTGEIAQNGIQISRGASASVSGNHISENDYTPDSYEAAGILIFTPGANLGSGTISIGPNTVTGNEIGIWTNDPRTLASLDLAGVTGNRRDAVASFEGGYEGAGDLLEYPAWDRATTVLASPGDLIAKQSGDLIENGESIYVVDWNAFNGIQTAIEAVSSGGVVNLIAGIYDESSTLAIDKSLTLRGAGEGQSIIDARDVSGYGIEVTANSVTLEDFTLYGPSVDAGTSYGIKVAPRATNPANRLRNFAVRRVTARGAGRAELDLNGVDGATMTNFTANGAPVGDDSGITTRGAGIQLTDSANVTISGSTTLNNGWGGVALFQANRAFNQRSSGIVIDGDNTFQESIPVYLQRDAVNAKHAFGALDIRGFDFAVRNDSLAEFTWLQPTQQRATDFAVNTPDPESSYVQAWNGAGTTQEFYVGIGNMASGATRAMSISTAIDASSIGATIHVDAGTYDEHLTVNGRRNLFFADSSIESLTLNGGGSSIGGTVTADSPPWFRFNGPVVLLDNAVLQTSGGMIAPERDAPRALPNPSTPPGPPEQLAIHVPVPQPPKQDVPRVGFDDAIQFINDGESVELDLSPGNAGEGGAQPVALELPGEGDEPFVSDGPPREGEDTEDQ